MALGTTAPVRQSVRVDALTLHKRIQCLIGDVAKSGELNEAQRRAIIEHLNELDAQAERPAAQRELSKIGSALKLLPGLLSTVSTLRKAWEALEPIIKAHLPH